jgi:hypothetical protein
MSGNIPFAGRRRAFRTGNSIAVTIDADVLAEEYDVEVEDIEEDDIDLPAQYDADAEEYRVDLSVLDR